LLCRCLFFLKPLQKLRPLDQPQKCHPERRLSQLYCESRVEGPASVFAVVCFAVILSEAQRAESKDLEEANPAFTAYSFLPATSGLFIPAPHHYSASNINSST
jgi:hypothetical protein